jgi:hypothetical protein
VNVSYDPQWIAVYRFCFTMIEIMYHESLNHIQVSDLLNLSDYLLVQLFTLGKQMHLGLLNHALLPCENNARERVRREDLLLY